MAMIYSSRVALNKTKSFYTVLAKLLNSPADKMLAGEPQPQEASMELNIMGALNKALDEKDLKELMQEKVATATLPAEASQPENAAAVGPAVVNNISSANEESSGNLMSRNFGGASEGSEYLEAAKKGRAAAREIEASLGEIIMSTMPERLQEVARNHGSERASRIQQYKEEMEAGNQAMDQMKAVIEEGVQEAVVEASAEAVAQTDAKGEPVESVATGEAGSAAANPQIAAAAISAYNPAAAAVVTAPAPVAPEAPSQAGGASTGNGLAKVAVDVSI